MLSTSYPLLPLLFTTPQYHRVSQRHFCIYFSAKNLLHLPFSDFFVWKHSGVFNVSQTVHMNEVTGKCLYEPGVRQMGATLSLTVLVFVYMLCPHPRLLTMRVLCFPPFSREMIHLVWDILPHPLQTKKHRVITDLQS